MSINFIDASSVNVQKREEQESKKAKVKADVAIVLPMDVASDARFDIDYNEITKAINDYVERYTIDPRISKIEYELSIPELPDKNATDNLKDTLTGAKSKVETLEKVVKVDNDAIKDDKVTLKFELSVKETVFLDKADNAKNNQTEQPTEQGSNAQKEQNPGKSKAATTKTTQQAKTNNQAKGNSHINISDEVKDNVVDYSNKIGSGIAGAMTNDTLKRIKVGDNEFSHGLLPKSPKVYTNPKARGNQYYKIVGTVPDEKLVKGLGIAGKAISYGTTIYKAGDELSKASTSQEKGRVVGATTGKVLAGAAAGKLAADATTIVLVTIAGTAGVAAAPVTLVIIAGCSIVAGLAASSAVEQYGEEVGGNIGVEAVNFWQSRTGKK